MKTYLLSYDAKATLQKHVIFLLLAIAMLLLTTPAKAQDVLVGLTSNGGPEGKGTVFSIKSNGTNFSLIKSFADWGTNPTGSFIEGSDGNLYGTTYNGGTYNYGTVIRVTTKGQVKVLHQFDYANDGAYSTGKLVEGPDGSFYGVAPAGGINNYGTIYKITPDGAFKVLKSPSYKTEGGKPIGHLVLGTDGFLYGISYGGGTYGYGTIFKISTSGAYSVLYHLNGPKDGASAYGGLVQGKDGALYGLTYNGGTYGFGTIFKYVIGGAFTVLHHFSAATDGGYPRGSLIQAKDKNLYGLTYSGGKYNNGTIFQVTTKGAFSVIRHLAAGKDGGYPDGALCENNDGFLYGITNTGGGNSGGTIFKINTTGTTYTVLKALTYATDGAYAEGSLVKAKDGAFYGMTKNGGEQTYGTIFKITSAGDFSVLNTFHGGVIGNTPYENLTVGDDNAYYGLTSNGGKYGYGTIFKICGGKTTAIYHFDGKVNGGTPKGSLLKASDGNFYGMAGNGGASGAGLIYKVTKAGKFSVVYQFKPATDGGYPLGSLIEAKDGFLYGMCASNGPNNGGTLFRVSKSGNFKLIRAFTNATDGSSPEGSLVEGTDGTLYGATTNGSRIFKIKPGGDFTILHSMVSSTDGVYPLGSLVFGGDGNLYGTASQSGSGYVGTIFRISTSGSFKVVKTLNATTDGSYPKGDLVRSSDGSLYGMTSAGGAYKAGTIFKISASGSFSVLKHLNLITEGGAPFGGLILAPKNTLIANAQSITTDEDVAKNITLIGSGGSPLSYNIVNAPEKGKVTQVADANFKYVPNKNANGKDSFSFSVSVGCLSSAPAKVNIAIKAINDAPVLKAIANQTGVKGTQMKFKAVATDVDGDVITYTLVGAPSGAKINASTGAITFTPTAAGTYTFSVKATDNGSPVLYDQKPVTVIVTNTFAANLLTGNDTDAVEDVDDAATIYPNPAKTVLNIELNANADVVNTSIVDAKGKLITVQKQQAAGKAVLQQDVSSLAPGVYFIIIQTGKTRQTLKFIKE